MKCFVIAMKSEAEPLVKAMDDNGAIEERIIDYNFVTYRGKLFGEDIAVLICGVGKVNAASGTQYAIDKLGADIIINLGVAGGLNDTVKIGKVYSVSEVVQYDFDLTQLNGTEIGTVSGFNYNYMPLSLPEGFRARKVGTGDRFNDSLEDYKLLTEVLDADIRDMELGAIAQVCIHAKDVKCYAFKCISDLAGSGSTTEQFKENLELCAHSIGNMLELIVKSAV